MANVLPVLMPVLAAAAVVTYLDVFVVFKVVFGLGLVIFLHELGHFAAAKWCGVYVKTFSIGFGKPIPGMKFQKGETLYMVGWIPLGGYVEMMGESDTEDPEEAARDPRSLKNKSVGQRMLIVSAGVIMNIILAMGLLPGRLLARHRGAGPDHRLGVGRLARLGAGTALEHAHRPRRLAQEH